MTYLHLYQLMYRKAQLNQHWSYACTIPAFILQFRFVSTRNLNLVPLLNGILREYLEIGRKGFLRSKWIYSPYFCVLEEDSVLCLWMWYEFIKFYDKKYFILLLLGFRIANWNDVDENIKSLKRLFGRGYYVVKYRKSKSIKRENLS